MTFQLKGHKEVLQALAQLGTRAPAALGKALWNEANSIMIAAKAITPVDTGVLKNSGFVNLPTESNGVVTVVMGFGGAASDYAEIQHEELSYYHTPPTQAKYLEQPFEQASQTMSQRLVADLQKAFR